MVMLELEMSIPTINNYYVQNKKNKKSSNDISSYAEHVQVNGLGAKKKRGKDRHINSKALQFKDGLGWVAKTQYTEPTTKPVLLFITFYFKKNRDIDNPLKPVLDALEGIIYVNDMQVQAMTVIKRVAKRDKIVIEIIELDTNDSVTIDITTNKDSVCKNIQM